MGQTVENAHDLVEKVSRHALRASPVISESDVSCHELRKGIGDKRMGNKLVNSFSKISLARSCASLHLPARQRMPSGPPLLCTTTFPQIRVYNGGHD